MFKGCIFPVGLWCKSITCTISRPISKHKQITELQYIHQPAANWYRHAASRPQVDIQHFTLYTGFLSNYIYLATIHNSQGSKMSSCFLVADSNPSKSHIRALSHHFGTFWYYLKQLYSQLETFMSSKSIWCGLIRRICWRYIIQLRLTRSADCKPC